jgi:hypothetical protein
LAVGARELAWKAGHLQIVAQDLRLAGVLPASPFGDREDGVVIGSWPADTSGPAFVAPPRQRRDGDGVQGDIRFELRVFGVSAPTGRQGGDG